MEGKGKGKTFHRKKEKGKSQTSEIHPDLTSYRHRAHARTTRNETISRLALQAPIRSRWAQARAQAGQAQARFLEIWKSGTWKSGNLGSKKIQKIKILKSKSVLPKMSGRSGLTHLSPSGLIFGGAGKMQKMHQKMLIFLGGPMGPIHSVWDARARW